MAERLKSDNSRHSATISPASRPQSLSSTHALPHPAVVRALTAPVGQAINSKGRDDGDDSAHGSEGQVQAQEQIPAQDGEARTRPGPLKTSRTLPLGTYCEMYSIRGLSRS